MCSRMVAQIVWDQIATERICPTDYNLKRMCQQLVHTFDPDFIWQNALDRLKGPISHLRDLIAAKNSHNTERINSQINHHLRSAYFLTEMEEHYYRV